MGQFVSAHSAWAVVAPSGAGDFKGGSLTWPADCTGFGFPLFVCFKSECSKLEEVETASFKVLGPELGSVPFAVCCWAGGYRAPILRERAWTRLSMGGVPGGSGGYMLKPVQQGKMSTCSADNQTQMPRISGNFMNQESDLSLHVKLVFCHLYMVIIFIHTCL